MNCLYVLSEKSITIMPFLCSNRKKSVFMNTIYVTTKLGVIFTSENFYTNLYSSTMHPFKDIFVHEWKCKIFIPFNRDVILLEKTFLWTRIKALCIFWQIKIERQNKIMKRKLYIKTFMMFKIFNYTKVNSASNCTNKCTKHILCIKF